MRWIASMSIGVRARIRRSRRRACARRRSGPGPAIGSISSHRGNARASLASASRRCRKVVPERGSPQTTSGGAVKAVRRGRTRASRRRSISARRSTSRRCMRPRKCRSASRSSERVYTASASRQPRSGPNSSSPARRRAAAISTSGSRSPRPRPSRRRRAPTRLTRRSGAGIRGVKSRVPMRGQCVTAQRGREQTARRQSRRMR